VLDVNRPLAIDGGVVALVGWCWSRWRVHFIKYKPMTMTTMIVVVVIPCSSSLSLAPHCHSSSLVCVRSWVLAVVYGPWWVVMGAGGRLCVFVLVSGRLSSFLGGCLQSWSIGRSLHCHCFSGLTKGMQNRYFFALQPPAIFRSFSAACPGISGWTSQSNGLFHRTTDGL
jgi:hypothetical protein